MIDDDLDAPEDFEKDVVSEKPSLKEVWENNPALKMAAIAVGGALLIGVYMIFFAKGDDDATRAVLRVKDMATAKQVPGKEEVDPAYRKALEETNKKAAEQAAQQGGSSLPVPIAIAKGGGLDIPEMPEKPNSDVLAEWKKVADAGRMKSAKEAVEEENSAPPPEVVPMVQTIKPQQVAKQNPDLAKHLVEQMRVILTAQAPPLPRNVAITELESPWVVQKKAKEKQETAAKTLGGTGVGAGGGVPPATTADPAKTIVPAGSVAYAQLMTELNSDVQGPVLAQVLSGPFAGGRLIGKISVKDEYIVIDFNRAVKDTVSYKVSAVALDENTTLAGQATDVDHHYLVRVILPAAAKFIEGYGSAVAETGTTVSQTSGDGQATEVPKPSAKESIYKGVEEASSKVSEILDKGAQRPITVKIAKGTTMGVFFTDTVTTKDAEK